MKEGFLKQLRRRLTGKPCRFCGKKFYNRGPHMAHCKEALAFELDAPGAAGKEGERK